MRSREVSWWILTAIGLALTALGTWFGMNVEPYGFRSGAPVWAIALGVLALASWLADRDRAPVPRRPWQWRDTAAVVCILIVSAGYRLWRLHEYPPPDAFGFEEFQTGGLAYGTLQDWWDISLEFPLTDLLPALSFRVFGLSSYALRLPFLLSGIVAPIFLYTALRRVVVTRAAWASALLFATNRWAATASRFADEIFLPVSVVALSAWLLICVAQEGSFVLTWALALVSGDLLYAYSGYRALPFIALAAAALWAVSPARNPVPAAQRLRLCVTALSVWAVMLSPGMLSNRLGGGWLFFEALARHHDAWGPDHTVPQHLALAARRLYSGWAVFARSGDNTATLNIPAEPMFDPISAVLMTLAMVAACAHWRDRGRRVALATLAIPFIAAALIPVNFNAQRYFVLLVPIFFLVGYWFDDWLRWSAPRSRAATAALAIVVLLAAALNRSAVRRLVDDPVVRDSFRHGENTVLAAVHSLPAGSAVELMTVDGANALEASDYRWFTAHVEGGRPDSLTDAVAAAAHRAPQYWIVQGQYEAALLPRVLALTCPAATTTLSHTDRPTSTVGVSVIDGGAECHPPSPERGLRATYRIGAANGGEREVTRIDPALCAYTIPWRWGWQLQEGTLKSLQVEWLGSVRPSVPGWYRLHLEVQGARAVLHAGSEVNKVVAPVDAWERATVEVQMGTDPLPLSIVLHAQRGFTPRVRLLWTQLDGSEEIIPPTSLSPSA